MIRIKKKKINKHYKQIDSKKNIKKMEKKIKKNIF